MSKPAAKTPKNLTRDGEWQGMNWLRQDKRLAIYLRDGHACAYCGVAAEQLHLAVNNGVKLSIDHVLPANKGGSNHVSNLVTCCSKCNSRRQDMELGAWLTLACGERAETVAAFIATHITLDLAPFRAEAKAIIARRAPKA